MRPLTIRFPVLALILVAAAFTVLHGQRDRAPGRLDLRAGRAVVPSFQCGTPQVRAVRRGLIAAEAMADGEPVSFKQDPPLVGADLAGPITLRDFMVVGDKTEVRFMRFDPDRAEDDPNIETWTRTGTSTIDGHIVSLFNPSWPDSEFARVLRRTWYGFDGPFLYWGQLIVTAPDPANGTKDAFRNVFLRMRTTNLPASRVEKISNTVQYASHVVNLVVPDYGNARVAGGSEEFQEDVVTKKFYEHFKDTYDGIAIVPEASHLAEFSAFHGNVKNDVTGLGEGRYDFTARFGSGGTLRGVEVYLQAEFATNAASNHEIHHQWGNYMNWDRIAGITRVGHQPQGHAPLWSPRETMVGAVLPMTRRVKLSASTPTFFPIAPAGSDFEIERTPPPVRYHPIEMYAMGKLAQPEVPELYIFEDQGQFDLENGPTPDPGTKLEGNVKIVRINDILREHGARSGPSPTEWRRATVVVSREGLLPQEQMDYWNFYAQRLEDPERSGVTSYAGVVGFDAATDNQVDLRTDIDPKEATAAKIEQPLDVSFPRFGRRDWRGVEFDDPVPSRYVAGERVTLAGRVTATDRTDFNQVLLSFSKYGGAPEDDVDVAARITGGRFTSDVVFQESQKGLYILSVYLFWPNAGGQYPRTNVTPVVVQ